MELFHWTVLKGQTSRSGRSEGEPWSAETGKGPTMKMAVGAMWRSERDRIDSEPWGSWRDACLKYPSNNVGGR